ncbi:MAG: Cysteine--tRNA ligase [candidate division WS2 bacterium]|nr:Cysteine--tRNA ligase [Candidatus Lithacetigena glycinireducens]
MLRIYNTLTKKKELFRPIKDKKVGLYSCGPTVYNFAHIGNLRTYIFVDILKRTLTYFGYSVKHVMNITDVGHLTSDADEGEDKLEMGAKREHKSVWKIAHFYERAFKKDIARLNVLPPTLWTRATDHIDDQIKLIKKLQKKGFTYEGPKAVYFDTSKAKNYGKLAGLRFGKQRVGAGVRSRAAVEIDPDKKTPAILCFGSSASGNIKIIPCTGRRHGATVSRAGI